uniref:Histone chaperone asf1 n=1 Tax=Rhabditophanes sp. KR3021 TaxID=114890 RepID=A0AC35TZI1_9BILA
MSNLIVIKEVNFPENPAKFTDILKVGIQFECSEATDGETKFDLIYVGSAKSREFDQILDTITFETIPVGVHTVHFEVKHPDISKIPKEDLTGVTAIILDCYYKEQLFMQTSWFCAVNYTTDELIENPPTVPMPEQLTRNIDKEDVRVVVYDIKWKATDADIPLSDEPKDGDEAEIVFSANPFSHDEIAKFNDEISEDEFGSDNENDNDSLDLCESDAESDGSDDAELADIAEESIVAQEASQGDKDVPMES